MPMKRHAPATARNRAAIAQVLERVLPARAQVLEVASGTGEHAVYFAQILPSIVWQPSDLDPLMLESVRAHLAESNLPNVREPITLDAASADWPVDHADAIVCINMIHIAPLEACRGLLAAAGRVLPAGGHLVVYGPYRIAGRPTAPSNEAFDASLRSRDPRWGLRELGEVEALARPHGLVLDEVVDMPANNITAVFTRQPGQSPA
jgi:SAM-dependent methyltransferase